MKNKFILGTASCIYLRGDAPKHFIPPIQGRLRTGLVYEDTRGRWPIFITPRLSYVAEIRSKKGERYDFRISFADAEEFIDSILGLSEVRKERAQQKSQSQPKTTITKREPHEIDPKKEVIYQRVVEEIEAKRTPYREYQLQRAITRAKEQRKREEGREWVK